jgi:hypothetical protein
MSGKIELIIKAKKERLVLYQKDFIKDKTTCKKSWVNHYDPKRRYGFVSKRLYEG